MHKTGIVLGLCLITASAAAEVLTMPQDASADTTGIPGHGLTMDQVLAAHGEPSSRMAAVGQPPITRWDYGHYVVYFEHDKVIQAVISGQPLQPRHTEGLTARQ